MTDKEKIKAEIERLQKPTMDINHNFTSDYNQGLYDGLSQLELFIDSLQDVSETDFGKKNVGEAMEELEEKIALYEKYHSASKDKCNGCNNTKGCITCVDGSEWAHIEETTSDDLEKASNNYVEERRVIDESRANVQFNCFDLQDAFKEGANWQKRKFLQEGIEWMGKGWETELSDVLKEASTQYGKENPITYSTADAITEYDNETPSLIFMDGAKWQKEQTIDKACEWLYLQLNEGKMECGDIDNFVQSFKKSMKE